MVNNNQHSLQQKFCIIVITALILFSIAPFFSSCQKSCNPAKQKGKLSQDSTVYSLENFTPYVLDTFIIANYFRIDTTHQIISDDIYEFYQKRFFQYAWFTTKGFSPSVTLLLNRLNNASNLSKSELKSIAFVNQTLENIALDSNFFKKNKGQLAKYELDFTAAYFHYAIKEFNGIDKNPKDLEWFIPRKKKNYQLLLERIACCEKENANFEPTNIFYRNLKKKLVYYKQISPAIKSIDIKCDSFPLKLNDNDSVIAKIKYKLTAYGDLVDIDSSILFDMKLEKAVKHFQERMGIDTSGVIDKITFLSINQDIDILLRKIIINMERLRWMTDSVPNSYFLVNIPEFKLHIFDKGKYDWSMNVVVGTEATATTIFEDEMSHVVLNPYWGVPSTIVKNEIIPAMLRNSSYISKHNMEVLNNNEVVSPYAVSWHNINGNPPFTVRQKPGPNNALGKVKFLFPNNYNIYFHDTPAKRFFNERKRTFSHGCIRLGEPLKLAEYILLRDSSMTKEQFQLEIKKEKENWIALKHKIPVIISYFTAWVDHNGILHFRDDIYHHDTKLEEELFN